MLYKAKKPTGPLTPAEELIIRRRVKDFWAHSELVRLLATLDEARRQRDEALAGQERAKVAR